ncbi:MAG TPA: peptidase M50 [Clostridia bacterium]|nr:peptidase M50 [Clostridia bacterium]
MRFGRLFGIKFIINDFFILLMLGYALLGVLKETLLLFALVTIHELVHLLAARRFGLKPGEVEIFPFGGVARIDGMLEHSPKAEILVSLAGPACNLLLYGLGRLFWPWLAAWPLGELFLQANLMLGVFNLLPALPLDGGRACRAWLAKSMGFYRATDGVLKLSKGLSAAVGIWGLLGIFLGTSNLHTLFMAAFLYGAVLKEESRFIYIFIRYLIHKGEELKRQGVLPVKQYVTTEGITLGEVAEKLTPGYYHLVLVMGKGGREWHTLSEHQIVQALLEHGKYLPLGKLVS